jgi:aryl-alcohol dehydrogenase-like predicted oxidoreductase
MQYRFLGSSGLKVSELSMGTQTFGWGADERAAFSMADVYAGGGGNLFDTSSTYNGGASEEILGSWLASRKNRHDMVVATKVFFETGKGPNDFGLSRQHILRTVDESLRRLKTDTLTSICALTISRLLSRTLSALTIWYVRERSVISRLEFHCVSDCKILMLCRSWMESFVSLQAEYSLIVRSTEWNSCLCEEEGLPSRLVSLAGGCSRKIRRGERRHETAG